MMHTSFTQPVKKVTAFDTTKATVSCAVIATVEDGSKKASIDGNSIEHEFTLEQPDLSIHNFIFSSQ